MAWSERRFIYSHNNPLGRLKNYSQGPVVDLQAPGILRIYYAARDSENHSYPTYIEVSEDDPSRILYEHKDPILTLGEQGCFDDSGIMPAWAMNVNNEKYLYYSGWNTSNTVPYRNNVGFAVSKDGGMSFERIYQGPILDRNYIEPYFSTAPSIRIEDGIWKAWYGSGEKWKIINGKFESFYNIKYAESKDGLSWVQTGLICIDFKTEREAGIVRPYVFRETGIYKMYYCYRNFGEFRNERKDSYRIGYAESADGKKWERMDDNAGIDIAESGWDSEMIAYPYLYLGNGKKYLFYNGNGFGKSGFGFATWVD